jgi:cytoskeletal protein CcmA (bactofilin family)
MTCPSTVVRSMYADAALAPPEAAAFEQHLRSCHACQDRVAALRTDGRALRSALQQLDDMRSAPAFRRPLTTTDVTVIVTGMLAVAGGARAFWGAVDAAIPNGLRWLSPLDSGGLLDLLISFILWIANEGTVMWTSINNFAGAAAVLALLAWGTLALLKNRAGTAVLLSLLTLVVLPSLGHALEIRRGEMMTVAADETIDDTLIVVGETISVDGNVNGDLLAFARRVIVRGNVSGDVISGAETVTIEGAVGGNVFGFGRVLTIARTRVARNLYGFGRDVEVASDAEIAGNAMTFANNVDIDGRVGLDLTSFASEITLSGNVQRNVQAFASEVTLLPSARVGGNLTAHIGDPDNLQIAGGATVGGSVDRDIVERPEQRNRYLTAEFYVGQMVRLGAAFLTGLCLLWLFPALRNVSLPNSAAALRAAGLGLVTAVTLPVAALLACITIVGLPLGLTAFLLGAIGLYFAKTVLAQVIGRALFQTPSGEPHYAATLLAGLVIVLIAVNVPFVGPFANLVLTLVGLGLIVAHLLGAVDRQRAG